MSISAKSVLVSIGLIFVVSSCTTTLTSVPASDTELKRERGEDTTENYFKYFDGKHTYEGLVEILVSGRPADKVAAFWTLSIQGRDKLKREYRGPEEVYILTSSIVKTEDLFTQKCLVELLSDLAFENKLAIVTLVTCAESSKQLREPSLLLLASLFGDDPRHSAISQQGPSSWWKENKDYICHRTTWWHCFGMNGGHWLRIPCLGVDGEAKNSNTPIEPTTGKPLSPLEIDKLRGEERELEELLQEVRKKL